MDKLTKWEIMTKRQKTECIVQDVMGWTYFSVWDIMHTARWALEHNDSMTYPYAFWNNQLEGVCVFYHEDEDALLFNPLESMSDAWQVVRRINNPYPDHARPGYAEYSRFIDVLEKIIGSNMFYDLFYCDKDGDHLTPERICLAALEAIGVDYYG